MEDYTKPVFLLEKLIKETTPTNAKDNFKNISRLVQRSSEMRKEEQARSAEVEQHFDTLKQRITESTNFLEKAKKDLENIDFKFTIQRMKEGAENLDYEEFMKKTDEEIDAEMESVKAKMAALKSKMNTTKRDSDGAEKTFLNTLETLKKISGDIGPDD